MHIQRDHPDDEGQVVETRCSNNLRHIIINYKLCIKLDIYWTVLNLHCMLVRLQMTVFKEKLEGFLI
jgi:hypothetical protein